MNEWTREHGRLTLAKRNARWTNNSKEEIASSVAGGVTGEQDATRRGSFDTGGVE
jgi:hypothetical protein